MRIYISFCLGLLFPLLSLCSTAYAQTQVLLPHLTASSTSATFGQPISPTEVVDYGVFDGTIHVSLITYDGNGWQVEDIGSHYCNCDSVSRVKVTEHYAAFFWSNFSTATGESNSQVWALSKSDSGVWHELNQPGVYNYSFEDALISPVFNGNSVDGFTIWVPGNGGWQQYDQQHLPDELNDLHWGIVGSLNDFIVTDQRTNSPSVEHYVRQPDGQWLSAALPVPGFFFQYQIHFHGNTLMLVDPNEHIDLPNQGAAYLLRRNAGTNQWRVEQKIIGYKPRIETNTRLLNENTALIQNIFYTRSSNGSWTLTAALDTAAEIQSAFLVGNSLTWQGRSHYYFSDWSSRDSCTAANTLCSQKIINLSLSPRGDVLPSTELDRFDDQSVVEDAPRTGPVRFLSTGTDIGFDPSYRRKLYQYLLSEDSNQVQKSEVEFCSRLVLQADDCWIRESELYNENALIQLDNKIYSMRQSAQGSWSSPEEVLLPPADFKLVKLITLRASKAVVYVNDFNDARLYILQLDGLQWNIASSISLTDLDIRWGVGDVFDVDIKGNRLSIRDFNGSGVHLLVNTSTDGSLSGEWIYEATLNNSSILAGVNVQVQDRIIVGDANDGDYAAGEFEASFQGDFLHPISNTYLGTGAVSPGAVSVFKQNGTGEWIEAQRITGDTRIEHSFGQQVYAQDEWLVVASVRPRFGYQWNAEPNYSVYIADENGFYTFVRRIEHVSDYRINCFDCSYAEFIRWDARLLDGKLFLPVKLDDLLDEVSSDDLDFKRYHMYDLSVDGSRPVISSTATAGQNSSSGNENSTPTAIGTNGSAVCVDTDGDGWGWDGVASCRMSDNTEALRCIDTDGDGWGWDGEGSCIPSATEQQAACIDTDNDGWGWDGTSSCIVSNSEPVVTGSCIDFDGDGWGWNGVESCRP